MATQKGKGVVFGISSSGFKFTALDTTHDREMSFEPTGQTLRHEAEIIKFKNKQGEDVGAVVFNQSKRLTLNCYPVHSGTAIDSGNNTTAVQTADSANNLPEPGEQCVILEPGISGTPGSGGDAEIAGNWMVESCEKAKTNGEITTFTLELANSVNNDYSATVA